MESSVDQNAKQSSRLVFPLIISLVVVLFLFFIDEGYYDFRWMKDVGNWIVFFLYLAVIFPILWGISWLFHMQRG